jgi:hypothetical protein
MVRCRIQMTNNVWQNRVNISTAAEKNKWKEWLRTYAKKKNEAVRTHKASVQNIES